MIEEIKKFLFDMIDWITAIIPVREIDPNLFFGGMFISIDGDGNEEWSHEKGKNIPGSYESNIRVSYQSLPEGPHLRLDGNPAKWIQGHNVFGSNNLIGLVNETMHQVFSKLGIIPSEFDRKIWQEGRYNLNRVDCTEMWEFPSKADVLAWLNVAQFQSKSRHGRSLMTGGTLYFGKNSRKYSIKFYCKGEEILVRKHKLNPNLPFAQDLINFSQNKLRYELVLRKPKLKDLDLMMASDWHPDIPQQLLLDFLNTLDISDQYTLSSRNYSFLKPSLQLAYQYWKNGNDLKSILKKNTFYRYRKKLLKYRVDISVAKSNVQNNKVPLTKIYEMPFCTVPDWALGKEIYFDPVFNRNREGESRRFPSEPPRHPRRGAA